MKKGIGSGRKVEKKVANIRPNFQRDMEMAQERLPVAMGGEGLTVEQIAERHGVSSWGVYKALAHGDVREVQRQWYEYILDEQRELGPAAVKALGRLIEAGDPATVNAFFKRMGPPEPVADVSIEKLEFKVPPEYMELVRKLNPAFADASSASDSDGAYRCPACSYTTADIGELGNHMTTVHRNKVLPRHDDDEELQ